jgi:thiaminase
MRAGVGERRRDRTREAFLQSSRCELAFWEMAWQLERVA